MGYSSFIYINSFDLVYSSVYSSKTCHKKVYHCVDLIGGEPYIAKHGLYLEPQLSELSDLVITTSKALQERFLPINKHTYCIENRADIELFFQTREKPKEFKMLTGYDKTIIYTGNIV